MRNLRVLFAVVLATLTLPLIFGRATVPGSSPYVFAEGGDPPPPPIQYTLTLTIIENNRVIVNGQTFQGPATFNLIYDEGTLLVFSADAIAPYTFSHWEGALTGEQETGALLLTINKSVTAQFEHVHNVIVGVENGDTTRGTTVPYGAEEHEHNSPLTIQAFATQGHQFKEWFGGYIGTDNPATVTVDQPLIIAARFDQMHTVIVAPLGGDTIPGTTTPSGTNEYAEGTQLSIRALANPGYYFKEWLGSYIGTQFFATITVDQPMIIAASFQPEGVLTTAVVGQGTIDVQPFIDNPTRKGITAQPAAGWRFDHWEGDILGTNPIAEIYLDANKSVTAHFIQTLNLLVSATGTGLVDPTVGAHTFDVGTVVTLTATPAESWRFDSWSGSIAGATNPAQIVMNANHTVDALFIQQHKFITTVDGNGIVLINGNPIDETYTGYVDTASSLTLEITPSEDWSFSHWSGTLTGSENPKSIVFSQDVILTAHLVPATRTLSIGTLGQGSVSTSGGQFPAGTELTVTATPTLGWIFKGWTGDYGGTSNPADLLVIKDMAITAVFEEAIPVTINFAGTGIGTVDVHPPSGDIVFEPNRLIATCAAGDILVLTANSEPGNDFVQWSGADVDGVIANQIEIEITEPIELSAIFDQTYELSVNLTGTYETGTPPAEWLPGETFYPQYQINHRPWGNVSVEPFLPNSFEPDLPDPFTKRLLLPFLLRYDIPSGTDVTLSATPERYPDMPPFAFSHWAVAEGSSPLTTSNSPIYTIVGFSSDVFATAIFVEGDEVELTIRGGGEVQVDQTDRPVIMLSQPQNLETFLPGSTLQLTPIAEDGFRFVEWRVDAQSPVQGSGPSNILAVNSGTTSQVTAVFESDLNGTATQKALTVAATGGGYVYNHSTSSVIDEIDRSLQNVGDTITLEAFSNSDWRFIRWAGNAHSLDSFLQFVLTEDRVVIAEFAPSALNEDDADADGLPDSWELSMGVSDALADEDGDSLLNFQEYYLGGDPLASDTDLDGLPDDWEARFFLALDDGAGDHGGAGNPDWDTRTNSDEFTDDTNPVVRDDPGVDYVNTVDVSTIIGEGRVLGSSPSTPLHEIWNPYTFLIDPLQVPEGEPLELQGVPDTGWKFSHWSGDVPQANKYQNPVTVTVQNGMAVIAVFEPQKYELVVIEQGLGTVVLDPPGTPYPPGTYPSGIHFPPGIIVQMKAIADPGWRFSHWSGLDYIHSRSHSVVTDMDGSRVVRAVFEPIEEVGYSVNLTGSGGTFILEPPGMGTPQPFSQGSRIFAPGTVVSITAMPDAGFQFAQWRCDLNDLNPTIQIVMDQDYDLQALFVGETPPVTTKITLDAAAGFRSFGDCILGKCNECMFGTEGIPTPGAVFEPSADSTEVPSTFRTTAYFTGRKLVKITPNVPPGGQFSGKWRYGIWADELYVQTGDFPAPLTANYSTEDPLICWSALDALFEANLVIEGTEQADVVFNNSYSEVFGIVRSYVYGFDIPFHPDIQFYVPHYNNKKIGPGAGVSIFPPLVARPHGNSRFVQWKVNDVFWSTKLKWETHWTPAFDGPYTVTAEFEPLVSLQLLATQGGAELVEGNEVGNAVCGRKYVKNTVVQLTAIPDEGWVFKRWDIDAGNLRFIEHSDMAVIQVTMDTDKRFRAVYVPLNTTSEVGIERIYVQAVKSNSRIDGKRIVRDRSDRPHMSFGFRVPHFEAGVTNWGRPDVYPDLLQDQATETPSAAGPFPRAFHLFKDELTTYSPSGSERPEFYFFQLHAKMEDKAVTAEMFPKARWVLTNQDGTESTPWSEIVTDGDDPFLAHIFALHENGPGLYRIKFELELNTQDPSKFAITQIFIPAAGATVDDWLVTEIDRIIFDYADDPGNPGEKIGWAEHWRRYVLAAAADAGVEQEITNLGDGSFATVGPSDETIILRALASIQDRFLDYQGLAWSAVDGVLSDLDADDAPAGESTNRPSPSVIVDDLSLALRYNFTHGMRLLNPQSTEFNDWDDPSYLTLHGVVIPRSKLNLSLGTVFARELGYSTNQIRGVAQLNQFLRALKNLFTLQPPGSWFDPRESQAAIKLGGALYDLWQAQGNNVTAADIEPLLDEYSEDLQPSSDNSPNLWPNDAAFDESNDQLMRWKVSPENLVRYSVMRRPDTYPGHQVLNPPRPVWGAFGLYEGDTIYAVYEKLSGRNLRD